MIIEITIRCKNGKNADFAVNDTQNIKDAINILRENHAIFTAKEEIEQIFSCRKNDHIDEKVTFAEAGIFNGDILCLD